MRPVTARAASSARIRARRVPPSPATGDAAGAVHAELVEVGEAGDDARAAVADDVDRLADDVLVDGADGDQRLVGQLAPGELVDLLGGFGRGRERVGGAELERGLPLELD